VNTYGQRFFDRRSAPATLLAGACGVYSDDLDSGTFSLVLENLQEAAPCSVADVASQPVILDHPSDAQAFHRDGSVVAYEGKRNLVVVISALLANMSMNATQLDDGFFSILATEFFTANSAAGTSQGGERGGQESWVFDVGAVIGGQKILNTDVDAGRRFGAGLDLGVAQITGEDGVPFISFLLERDGFDQAFDITMLFDADCTGVLDSQLIVHQLNAVTVGWELDATESAASFEARVSRFFSRLNSSEEALKGFVQASHGGLSTGKVKAIEVGIDVAFLFVPSRLLGITDRAFSLFPGVFALHKASVVQSPVCLEHNFQLSELITVGEDSEFVGSTHCLLSLLVFYVCLDRGFAGATNGAGVITSAPKSRESRSQRGELLSQISRRPSFETVYDLSNTKRWVSRNKDVDMIRHDFQRYDCHVKLFSNISNQLIESQGDVIGKNWSSVFWTPDDVILEGKNSTSIFAVPIHKYTVYSCRKVSQEKGGAHSPVA
jgi:hypothetical protein